MIEATSCGGVVIFRGKILLLYKNYRNRYEGWVLPKGTVESDEEYKDTAIREVKEETGASATIIQYVGKSHYSFTVPHDTGQHRDSMLRAQCLRFLQHLSIITKIRLHTTTTALIVTAVLQRTALQSTVPAINHTDRRT